MHRGSEIKQFNNLSKQSALFSLNRGSLQITTDCIRTDLSRMSANVTATMNGIQSMSSCFNPTAARIGETFAYCLLFLVSLVGNTFIAMIVFKTKTLRKPINFLIVNMAMSDLLVPIFLFPRELVLTYSRSWVIDGLLGQVLCKLSIYASNLSFTVSIQSLVLIAVDRFGAVMFPLCSPLINLKRCRVFILATWFIAMAIFCPNLFASKVVESPEGLACVADWKDALGKSSSYENFVLVMQVVIFCVPLVLITILYSAITLKIKSQKIPGEQSTNIREKRLKRKRNVLKLSVAIVLGFALCWLPLSIVWFMFFNSDRTITSCGFYYFWSVSLFLAKSNCAINPWICICFGGNYRQGLKNILSCSSFGSDVDRDAP